MRRRFSHEDAEDMVHDVFIKIASVRQVSVHGIQNGRAYLYRALHNRLVDFLRAKRPTISEAQLSTDSDTDDGSGWDIISGELGIDEDNTGFLLCFQGALHSFYDQDWEAGTAIDLAAIEGFSGKELAEVLGRTYGATREFLSQCKSKFQKILIELCYDYMPESVTTD
jgi:RNA polymerase sigma-70 factor (ECF subfamily)